MAPHPHPHPLLSNEVGIPNLDDGTHSGKQEHPSSPQNVVTQNHAHFELNKMSRPGRGNRRHRRKASSASEVIQAWQDGILNLAIEPDAPQMITQTRTTIQMTQPVAGGGTESTPTKEQQNMARRAHRRANRKKATSASATILAWRNEFWGSTKGTSSRRINEIAIQNRTTITPMDLDMLRSLENEYSAAARRTASQDRAERIWACQAGLTSVFFILVYFTLGTIIFLHLSDGDEEWTTLDTILFSVYTATTTGFGHITPPDTAGYYIFSTVYLLLGVAAMSIMVAQVFQWMELEANRAHDQRRARQLALRSEINGERHIKKAWTVSVLCSRFTDCCVPWFQETNVGRFLSVFLSLTLIAMIGGVPIGLIEGWTFLQTMYFSVVTMTTVGYGDLVPETKAGITILIVWLPLNVLFSSLYMGSVAKWYLGLSAHGIRRIRDTLNANATDQRFFDRSLTTAPRTKGNGDTELIIEVELDGEADDDSDTGSLDSAIRVPVFSAQDSLDRLSDTDADTDSPMILFENMQSTLTTMQDVLNAVHNNNIDGRVPTNQGNKSITDSMHFLSVLPGEHTPCFALRVLVKERIAAIIAYDICGGSHHVDVQDAFIVVRVGQWKDVVNKWSLPSGTWKAFRAAALEAMMLVGERALIREGPSALYSLSPDEFHSMFSPLVAAMGDPDTLDGWLRSTDDLARKYLRNDESISRRQKKQHREMTIQESIIHMPKSASTFIFASRKES